MAASLKRQVFPLILAEAFWALPYLSVGMVAAYLKVHNQGKLNQHFDIQPIKLGGVEGYPVDKLIEEIAASDAPIVLLSSYVWNHRMNVEIAAQIKQANPNSLILIGGPEVPKYVGETESFLKENPAIDLAVLGEGEITCAEVLSEIAKSRQLLPLAQSCLDSVSGLVLLTSTGAVRTRERTRVTNLEQLPSPYLTGEFEPWFRRFPSTILETNRGCPFGCTYCDWGSATLEKVNKFSLDRVTAEIRYIAKCESESIFIADANFGMLEQDIAIATALVSVKRETGYPKRLYTNFAKNGGRRLTQVIKILNRGGLLPVGIIALQTTDPATLKVIKRDNIRTSAYEKMMTFFNQEGIPMASDLMIGLPGQTVLSLKQDLQFCFNWKVSANGNFTSLMPNAPMAEPRYKEKFMITTDASGLVESTSSFSREDLQEMKLLFLAYQFFVCLGVLKYYLYYVQTEEQCLALDLLKQWLDSVNSEPNLLPLSRRVVDEIIAIESRTGDWALLSWDESARFFFDEPEAFYREFHGFASTTFGFKIEPKVLETLFKAQSAVMPKLGRQYPYSEFLPLDIINYFEQYKIVACIDQLNESHQALSSFGAATLRVEPRIKFKKSLRFVKEETHADGWELPSKLRFY